MTRTKNLRVCFSGGKTSAYMTYKILNNLDSLPYQNVAVVFANTGQEHDKTLDFVHNCDKHLGFNTIWIEANVIYEKGKGTQSKVVDYVTASRDGRPFEDIIKKYGIPSLNFPHCTRELKLNPLHHYTKHVLGWKDYDNAIGIRTDETRRVSKSAAKNGIVYPLVDWFPSDKEDVNLFWEDMSFNLGILEHQGNCKWCWKKSLKKHFLNLEENPNWYDFPEKMEQKYSKVRADKEGKPHYFFRGYKSTKMLREEFENTREIIKQVPINFDQDVGTCSESCEIFEMEDSKQ